LLSVLLLVCSGCNNTNAKERHHETSNTADCSVESSWITSPSFPTEVKKSAKDSTGNYTSNFCDFYQFSTQAYLYLMSPAPKHSGLRNFQVDANYPLLEYNGEGLPGNSCDAAIEGVTLQRSIDQSFGDQQAGSGSMIYAQDGNLIHYDVRFNKALCDLTASATEMKKKKALNNFPSGTTELKFAWKRLSINEMKSGEFVTQQQTISGDKQTFGLVGMHIAIATKEHPEFVWATYEHNANTPNCDAQGKQASADWTFASESCTAKLPGSFSNTECSNFNKPGTIPTQPITKTNICRQYPHGTALGDHGYMENLNGITTQNNNLYSALQKSTTPDQLTVLANYFNVGALWVSDITKSSGGFGVPNERGSLRLANSVAETDFQDVNLNAKFVSNCFGCHNYIGTEKTVNNNITSHDLSHIFKDIVIGQGKSIDVTSSKTITNDVNARAICDITKGDKAPSGVCQNTAMYLKWNGQWTNTNSSAGSVCGCEAID